MVRACRELGFEVVEVNASDARNKSDTKYKQGVAGKLSNRIKELVTNTAISLGGVSDTKPRRQVLIMDEVDGMSGAPLRVSFSLRFGALQIWGVCDCEVLRIMLLLVASTVLFY